ncbi:TPA: glycosyltransferase family 4 protein [Methanosarcinaceae archaeon]|nr:glycosyltransferase family 4 protein [Methanosarcinaceae archaeon]
MKEEGFDYNKIAVVFPKDSSAIFDANSKETFGGATVQMFLIANELNKYKDIDVTSLTVDFGRTDGEFVNGLKICNTFSKEDNIYVKIFKFHKAIQKTKPDVIIQHGLTLFSCLLPLYCKLFNIKFIYMFAHDVEVAGYYQTSRKKAHFLKLLINYSDIIITQNKYQHNKILDKYNIKTNILYNGFPIVTSFNFKKEHILWVARCDKWKCPEKFIKLAFLNKQYKFVMICNESAGNEEYYSHIKELVSAVSNLEFLSHLSENEMAKIYQKSLLLINTSDDEGFPQVFIQAAMNKVPIISLNVNPDNFITKYKCGIVCDGNEMFMSDSIQNLLNNSQKYTQLSSNAYNYAKENHDIVRNVEKLCKLMFVGGK